MEVERIIVGALDTNCYLAILNNECLVVDPGDDYNLIINYLKENEFKVVGILITHYHFDHIGALKELINETAAKVYDFHDKGVQKVCNFEFEVLENMGHTTDSVSFYFKKAEIMFVGDFIFKGDIGRYDLPTGDFKQMLSSLKRIKKFPQDIALYPGHGDSTTLARELKYNNYLGDV